MPEPSTSPISPPQSEKTDLKHTHHKIVFNLKMCLVSKREIMVFAQNGAYLRFGATPELGPFLAPRQEI